jgi:hypothetical protein
MDMTSDENNNRPFVNSPSLGISDNFPNRAMWEDIAKKFDGKFNIKHTSGNVFEMHTVTIPHKKWNIDITVSDTRPLKFQASFSSLIDFELVISWEDFIERIFKKFGKPEIEVGWKEFDKHYLIKSNRSDLTKLILTTEIQKTLLKHNVYSISYQTETASKTAELISVIQRGAGNKEMIHELIKAYKLLIDNLEKTRIIK